MDHNNISQSLEALKGLVAMACNPPHPSLLLHLNRKKNMKKTIDIYTPTWFSGDHRFLVSNFAKLNLQVKFQTIQASSFLPFKKTSSWQGGTWSPPSPHGFHGIQGRFDCRTVCLQCISMTKPSKGLTSG